MYEQEKETRRWMTVSLHWCCTGRTYKLKNKNVPLYFGSSKKHQCADLIWWTWIHENNKAKIFFVIKISKSEQKVFVPNEHTYSTGVQMSPRSQSSTTITGILETSEVVSLDGWTGEGILRDFCRCCMNSPFMRFTGSLFCSAFVKAKIECWNVSHFPYLPHLFHIKQFY